MVLEAKPRLKLQRSILGCSW